MKIIISPAKSMEEEKSLPTSRGTTPAFFKEAIQLNRKLAGMSKKELSDLMKISEKLAHLNYDRYQEFDETNTSKKARPAVYLYSGDVYAGLDAYTIPAEKLDRLQQTLRIITGMYGILKPLDLIQPYRLEMSTKLTVEAHKNLYEFWTEKITDSLNKELQEDELFLNLASKEYSKAIDIDQLKVPVISPVFKDFKNGELKIIAFHAKRARGAMVRYILDHDISDKEGVLGFDYMDYAFSEKHTQKENEPVFIR